MFGIMWRKMMRRLPSPNDRAASMNSMRLSDMIWPRTMRAMVSHSTAPMATKSKTMFRPKKTIRRMTKIVKGRAYMMSTIRIMSASILPPKKPATAP